MTDPIKPPGGAAPPSPDEIDSDVARPEGASSAFRQSLDRTSAAEQASAVDEAAGVDPIARVAADVRLGRIDVATAIDRLVERVMSGAAARALSPPRRGELEAHLRRSLAEDPTLRSLTRDLERAD